MARDDGMGLGSDPVGMLEEALWRQTLICRLVPVKGPEQIFQDERQF